MIEVGLWRVEDGVIAEAWYFGDELGLLRALELNPPDLTNVRGVGRPAANPQSIRATAHPLRLSDDHRSRFSSSW